jgi:peptidoglycan L-alanyl-D-glutamate endopeptidase CwlK
MPSRSLQDAEPKLRNAIIPLMKEFEVVAPGRSLVITCTYRSPEEQLALYAEGRGFHKGVYIVEDNTKVVTQLSGQPGHMSLHNLKPCRAVDVAVVIGGKVTWNPREYLPLGDLAVKHGLEWGGNWPHLKDYPHLQLPQSPAQA